MRPPLGAFPGHPQRKGQGCYPPSTRGQGPSIRLSQATTPLWGWKGKFRVRGAYGRGMEGGSAQDPASHPLFTSTSPSSATSGRAPCSLNGWGPTHGRREWAQPLRPPSLIYKVGREQIASHRCPRTRRGHRRGVEHLSAPSALGRKLCSCRALPGWGAPGPRALVTNGDNCEL